MTTKQADCADVPVDDTTTLEMLNTDPAAVYQRLRQQTPIVRLKSINRIVFTKAEDVYRVKTDTAHFGSVDTTTPMQRAFGGHTLMRKDGCEHQRERQAMVPSFAPTLLSNSWRAKFEGLVDHLLDGLEGKDTVDLFADFATPLSAGYVKLVLGIEQVSDEQLFQWATALVTGAMNGSFDPAIFEISDQANLEMNQCFDQVIDQQVAASECSVLRTMASAPDPIAVSQMRTNMKICIGGAVIESRDAILSTLFGLLSHPEQLRFCLAENAWQAACEEGLRWVAPIQASPRVVIKSLVMRGVLIPEGETVMAIQASANHDEAIWAEPHLFDVQRKHHANQTFGDGPHQCLGGDMYRMLASQVALPKLFARFPSLTLKDDAEVKFAGFAFRGPKSLPVHLS